jgi:hypothetical protein
LIGRGGFTVAVSRCFASSFAPARVCLKSSGMPPAPFGRRRRRIGGRWIGAQHVRQQRGRRDAVRQGVVDLRDERDVAVLQPLERPYLPQRTVALQLRARDRADQRVHLAGAAGRRNAGTLQMPVEVEVRVFDPHRMVDAARYLYDATTERWKQMQSLGELFAESFEGIAALHVHRIDNAYLQRVHVERRCLHIEKARVHPRHALHRGQCHTPPAREERVA